MAIDLLVLAGDASEVLEGYGLVACGRRENGKTRVDFWTKSGKTFQFPVDATTTSVDEIVIACLALAGMNDARRSTKTNSLLS